MIHLPMIWKLAIGLAVLVAADIAIVWYITKRWDAQ